jgi:hypothetical protein
MEGTMPKWLTPVLQWGGLALAVVFGAMLVLVHGPEPTAGAGATPAPSAAPVALYWVLLVVGLVAAVAGFALGRRKS